MVEKSLCGVQKHLLPIKLHYFLFYGGMAGTVPFMPVLAKGLGISATAVGLVYTIVPFCIFFSKPFFGYLTDYFQNIKLIVFILISVTTVAFLSVLFLPAVDKWTNVQIQCDNESKLWHINPYEYNRMCLKDTLKTEAESELSFRSCESNSSTTIYGTVSYGSSENNSPGGSLNFNNTVWLEFKPDINISCDCIAENSSTFKCDIINSCLIEEDTKAVYGAYQFWVFSLLAVISGTGSATVFCLSDAACNEVLGERKELYGKQRLWATISWGIATLLAGFLNDIASEGTGRTSYYPGFIEMAVLVIADLIVLSRITLTKANFSLNICQDVGKIFASCETVAFAVAVYIMGALFGLLWNYEFWFLQDLGATQTLLGLCVAVQCLVAEVPFFFFAGWFIKKIGYFMCVISAFAAFALRYGLYYILENPWMVLPIEVLHGIAFAVFFASMTGYASHNAPPGTEATMLGILGGLFEGLGVATGSLLGGIGFDKLGGRDTFLIASVVSAICVLSFLVVDRILRMFAIKR